METPYYGSRQMARHLRRRGYSVSRKRVRRLMRLIGLTPIYQHPRTSDPHPGHKVYPYLLRDLAINRPNQVWSTDITYIPMQKGLSISGGGDGLVQPQGIGMALVEQHGYQLLPRSTGRSNGPTCRPEVFNTDQGSQFTSFEFTGMLKANGVRISMDGKGRWLGNVVIERLWRSLKYECVYLNVFEGGNEARQGIGNWIDHYNGDRPHSTLDGQTPDEVYFNPVLGHAPIQARAA